MPGTGADEASEAAERLCSAIGATQFTWASGTLARLTVSIGVACTTQLPTTPEALLHAADRALSAAKRAGRNRVEIAVPPAPTG
jgi:diguanylate cyclase (GGDEF)-like protein